jgi:hypothetical protein
MHHDVMGDRPLFVEFGASITNNNQTTPIIGPSIVLYMSELSVSLMRFIVVFWGLIALVDDLSCARSSTAKRSRVCSNVESERPSLCIGRLSNDTSSSGDPFKA